MENSLYLAQIIGPLMIVISYAVLLDPKRLLAIYADFKKSHALTYFAGLVTAVLGIMMVLSHNIWTQSWVVLITILAWMILVKGVLLLVMPDALFSFKKSMMKNIGLHGVIHLALGIYLSYMGYFA